MSEQKFSDFTLNFNPGARGNDKAPTLKGKATVLHAGSRDRIRCRRLGPEQGQHRRTGFLQRHLHAQRSRARRAPAQDRARPRAQSARRLRAQEARHRPHLRAQRRRTLGCRRHRHQAAEILRPRSRAAASGEPAYIDLSAWHRPEHGFYSGNANLHDKDAAAAARAAKTAKPG